MTTDAAMVSAGGGDRVPDWSPNESLYSAVLWHLHDFAQNIGASGVVSSCQTLAQFGQYKLGALFGFGGDFADHLALEIKEAFAHSRKVLHEETEKFPVNMDFRRPSLKEAQPQDEQLNVCDDSRGQGKIR